MKLIAIVFLVLFSSSLFAGNLVVDLSKQKFYYYDNEVLKRSGSVSTGKKKHRTPTGSFEILSKQRNKKSKLYPKRKPPRKSGGAPMKYAMQIHGHIFIHQGKLPGYPASHGCIRLSRKNARYLFGQMQEGDSVRVRQ